MLRYDNGEERNLMKCLDMYDLELILVERAGVGVRIGETPIDEGRG